MQGYEQPHSWADCVKAVTDNEGLYERLRSNFKQLGKMAEEYATMNATGGFRHASSQLDRGRKKVCAPPRVICVR